jgi:hypothetical protein
MGPERLNQALGVWRNRLEHCGWHRQRRSGYCPPLLSNIRNALEQNNQYDYGFNWVGWNTEAYLRLRAARWGHWRTGEGVMKVVRGQRYSNFRIPLAIAYFVRPAVL